jgi:DNA-binding transcriptional ArsR family regulator
MTGFSRSGPPARRAIIRQLSGGERNLSELAAPLRMTFPAATKHVRVLEAARLVRRRVAGRQHLCRLEAAPTAVLATGPVSTRISVGQRVRPFVVRLLTTAAERDRRVETGY